MELSAIVFLVKALHQKRVTLTQKMQAIFDSAVEPIRELTAEENKQFEDLETDLTKLAVEIASVRLSICEKEKKSWN